MQNKDPHGIFIILGRIDIHDENLSDAPPPDRNDELELLKIIR